MRRVRHRLVAVLRRQAAKRVGTAAGCLALVLVLGLTAAGSAVQDYSGIYSGSYAGADIGTWTFKINPDGQGAGFSWSTVRQVPDVGLAAGTPAGHFSATMVYWGATLNGTIDAAGKVSCTWSSPYPGIGGSVTGRRNLPHELAAFSGTYAGTFTGSGSGSWQAAIDAGGVFTGTGWSNEDNANFELTGVVNYTGELFALDEDGVIVHAMINSAGSLQGTWWHPEGQGTITGGRAAPIQKPTVTTDSATSVTAGSATLKGTVNPNGAETSYHFEWGTSTAYGLETAVMNAGSGRSAVTVSAPVSGLAPGTPYHFRLVATNSAGPTTGGGRSFTTDALPPTVVTAAPWSIESFSASGGGTVTSDGGAAVGARGVCWSTSPNPTVLGSKTTDGSGTGAFFSNLTGLSPGTTYHVRAYAANSAGTAYGEGEEFTTLPAAPAVVTGGARVGSPESAVLHGKVNPNGAETTYFFEYGETTDYAFSTAGESAGDGTGSLAVSAVISGLTGDTTYHYRLAADNSQGASDGADAAFSTEILYVEPLGVCGGKTPCYATLQAAMDAAGTGATIAIAQEVNDATAELRHSKKLNLSGGWDDGFTAATGYTTISGAGFPAMAIEKGTLTVEHLILR
jgi:hypothetical protein